MVQSVPDTVVAVGSRASAAPGASGRATPSRR